MLSTISSISTLLLSFGILILSHGLQNTLLNIRGLFEGYSNLTIGLMGSAYFAGFILGTKLAGKYILKVGQIRTFAALVSIISSVSLLHVIYINPFFWIFLKFIYGICISGAYMVIESWLNALSNQKNRGQILSIYMIICFLGLFLGQIFIREVYVNSFVLFAIISILASLSLVPLILSKAKQPEEISDEIFSIKKLYLISPLAVIGSFVNGVAASAFWAFGVLFYIKSGFSVHDAAIFIAATFIGALLFQWPIGSFSDILNRRVVIILCSIVNILSCLFIMRLTIISKEEFSYAMLIASLIFGGFSYPLYSLLIALANDFLKPGMFVKASATLLTINGIGSVIGPFIAAFFMYIFGYFGLIYFLILLYLIISGTAYYRLIRGRKIPENTAGTFVVIPETSPSLYNSDPRFEESKKEKEVNLKEGKEVKKRKGQKP